MTDADVLHETKRGPKLLNLPCIYLPAKHPYTTAKWYAELFDMEAADFAPLDPHADLVVLKMSDDIPGGASIFFVQSNDKFSMNFNNIRGHNHAILMFQVKDIEEIAERMRDRGVEFAADGIKDRGGCGKEIAFYDPDGRKIEINDYGTK
ncbi:VOC family protein [Paenibacillus mesophilus]|uniref:VOC family protein n=1 Tax=Paenibacillus mesophilus TaxID=2582849 RepID=UPI0013051FF6|nr:VOC family protein [Paenibacillus mesophilus]